MAFSCIFFLFFQTIISEEENYSSHKWLHTFTWLNRHCSWRCPPVNLSRSVWLSGERKNTAPLYRPEPKRHITLRYGIYKMLKVRDMKAKCGNKDGKRCSVGGTNQSVQSVCSRQQQSITSRAKGWSYYETRLIVFNECYWCLYVSWCWSAGGVRDYSAELLRCFVGNHLSNSLTEQILLFVLWTLCWLYKLPTPPVSHNVRRLLYCISACLIFVLLLIIKLSLSASSITQFHRFLWL